MRIFSIVCTGRDIGRDRVSWDSPALGCPSSCYVYRNAGLTIRSLLNLFAEHKAEWARTRPRPSARTKWLGELRGYTKSIRRLGCARRDENRWRLGLSPGPRERKTVTNLVYQIFANLSDLIINFDLMNQNISAFICIQSIIKYLSFYKLLCNITFVLWSKINYLSYHFCWYW